MPAKPPLSTPPSHPDLEVLAAEGGFSRHLGVDVVRFRHRRFDGAWSEEKVYDIVRRGDAVAVVLYDPDRDSVVLIEQFRIAPLYGGRSPWQTEVVAGLIDSGETPEEVARRETREEANLELIGQLVPIQCVLPAVGSLDEVVWLYCARVDA
ncbi:MAG: NUDIX domain-containing protein, partial [Thiohalocapsa sp.]